MRIALILFAGVALFVAAPTRASAVVRLEIIHVYENCHVWEGKGVSGDSAKITVKRGTRVVIRISCPMDFDFTQLAGPPLNLGNPRTYGGTQRAIVFRTRGVYRLQATNVQTPEERNLTVLGAPNTLKLTVRVR